MQLPLIQDDRDAEQCWLGSGMVRGPVWGLPNQR
jgi:hypothetical protein